MQGGEGEGQGVTPLAGQIISELCSFSCSFSPETEFIPLILD